MLDKDNAVLVVVDVQGKLASLMHEKEIFYENLVKMIRGAQVLEIPIIWNEQLPDKLGPTIPQIKELFEDQSPLIKSSFSCCGNPDFSAHLESLGRRQILLTGMETHVCIYQSARDLLDLGYEVYLVADCVSSRTLENKQVAIEAIRDLGARVTSLEMALLDMLQIAEGNQFKETIKIIK